MGSIQNNPNKTISQPVRPQGQPNLTQTEQIQTISNTPTLVSPRGPSPETLRSQQLTNTQTVEGTVNEAPIPEQIEQTHNELQTLDLRINQHLNQHQPPQPETEAPQRPETLSNQQVHSLLVGGLSDSIHMEHFQFASESLNTALETAKLSEQGIEVLETTLEDNLKQLSKKEKHYNTPLYKLADKLGVKNRKLKLQNLQTQKNQLQTLHQQQISLHQVNNQSANEDINHYSELLNQSIEGVRQDSKAMMEGLKGNQPLIWNLGLQGKGQLQNTMARVTLEKLLGQDQMGELVDSLEAEFQQNDFIFSEVVAKSKLVENRIDRFKSESADIKRNNPEEFQQLRTAMQSDIDTYFAEEIYPLIQQLPQEIQTEMLDSNNPLNSNRTQNIVKMSSHPALAPSLYNVLSDEQKALADELVSGVQSEMPNKIVDRDSILVDGVTYSDRTFLAEAGFAEIYTYTSDDGNKIVVKQPKKPEDMSEVEFEQKVLSESVHELKTHYDVMGQGQQGHPNTVKLLGAIPTDQGPLIALEYIDGGNTLQFTLEKMPLALEGNKITQDDQETIHKHLIYQMMQGVNQLQELEMSHLDVKFDNFFIQKDGTVKLADFGMSKSVSQFQATRQDRGDAVQYQPPEMASDVLSHTSKFNLAHVVSNKVDTWAVGVMAFQMLKGEKPFDSQFPSRVEKMLSDFGSDVDNRVIENPQTPEDHLLNSMLHPDPSQRPSFTELMQNPIFDNLFENGQRGQFKDDVVQLTQRVFAD